MAHILIMPRQGNTVESCVLVEWKVKEGDTVAEETTVCSVETDKAAFEVPAGANGTVLKILHAEGDDVPVLDPIAVIGAVGENWQNFLEKEFAQRHGEPMVRPGAKNAEKEEAAVSSAQLVECRSPIPNPQSPIPTHISPRARNLLAKDSPSAIGFIGSGSGPGGRIIERDVKAVIESHPPLTAAARAAASGTLPSSGTGIGSRITTEDLTSVPPIPDPQCGNTATPIKGIRKVIADRMLKSLAETAQFTLNASAPVSRLQDLRARMNNLSAETGLPKISVNDFILFAVSRTLPRFTYMNAHKNGDTVTAFTDVHLGVAVDTPRGLMVPVIRNANRLSLAQIASEVKRLAKACQDGNVKPDELTGSTFTVTNLGSMGITSFTPILNIPEVAILGVCNIELKPIAQPPAPDLRSPIPDPQCGNAATPFPLFEPHIGFSLTINHQVVDGAPAARFLKALGETVANIDLELICTM